MHEDNGHLPSAPAVAAESAVSVPRSLAEIEALLGQIFAEVLSLEDVGLEDNFFDLGATSLLMVRARNEIKAKLGRELAMNDLFEHSCISGLARFLAGDDAAPKVAAAQARGARQNDLFQKFRKLAGKAT